MARSNFLPRYILIPRTAVLCAGICLLISLAVHAIGAITHLRNVLSDTHDSGLVKFPVPVRPAALTTIKSERLGLDADEEDWDSILPQGEGFIYLEQEKMHYIVSQYHQLHCLRSLRHYFIKRNDLQLIDAGHVNHCLIYLRQMVLCSSDVTLEPASHRQRLPDGRLTNAVTGVGVTHRCKDWQQVREYTEWNYEKFKETYNFRMNGTVE
ncbi:hypothetical protein OE88DRAFT_1691908 [Heliocybe sulcata]|uniref:Uncharacterized protein n=1 Tax=Heliocybe sulcata TaxID=5364 RepID=A0A5C3NF16_9AGAM|nr:hypothetical protein OE88DRAFT_1691908 [Heliocybe sulcata]